MAKKEKAKNFLEKFNLDFDKIILGNIGVMGIFLLFGIITYLKPYLLEVKTAEVILGIFLIIIGGYYIFEFLRKKDIPIFKLKIVIGVLTIILGLLAIINPFHLFKVSTLSLGIYLGLVALFKIFDSLYFKRNNFDGWLITLVVSFILLIFGIFIGINPMKTLDIVKAMGIFVTLGSILEVSILLMFYTKAQDIKKLFK